MPKKLEVPELKQVGAAIRGIRQAKMMTLEQVAKASGIDTGNLSRLERGLQGFSMEALAALCKVFGVSVSQLLAGTEITKNKPVPGKVGLCIVVPEVEILFSTMEGDRVQAIRKTDRVMNTTAKVGSKAFGFRLGGYEPMEGKFPAGMGIIVDPDEEPKHESYVLATVKGVPIFRQYIIEGARAFLKAVDMRYPLTLITRDVRILGVAKQAYLDI